MRPFSPRPAAAWPGFLLCAVMGVVLGLGAYTARYAEGTSYLSNDPRACVNCHIMRDQYDGWQKASHHGVATCNDCHTPHDFIGKYLTKAESGYHHSKGFTLQDFHEPIQLKPHSAEILRASCVSCHKEFLHDVLGPHQQGDKALDCLHCHARVGHGPTR